MLSEWRSALKEEYGLGQNNAARIKGQETMVAVNLGKN